MKKYTITLLLAVLSCSCFAQSSTILVRHDTALLRAEESEWIIKSLKKNTPLLSGQIGRSVPEIILESIKKGKIKAVDPETNKPIPAAAIMGWNMQVDSVMVFDKQGEISKTIAVKHELDPSSISQIRIFQDWYVDVSSGKFRADIKWIELLTEVKTSIGVFLGYRPFCRIYY